MKNSIISFVAIALMAVTVSFAQSSLVATLVHNDTITAFYGTDALQNAHGAAVNGDTINLSEGTFYASNITKGITLRGAGMTPDTVAHTGITTIAGNFSLINNGNNVTIEGIYSNHTIYYSGNVSNVSFIKCRLNTIAAPSEGNTSDANNRLIATFVNCRIVGNLRIYARNMGQTSAECINSIINSAIYSTSSYNNCNRSILFKNCIVRCQASGGAPGGATSTYNSCIIVDDEGKGEFDAAVTAYNCIDVSDSTFVSNGIFKNIGNDSNTAVTGYSNVFKTYKGGDIQDGENFELTATAKATYLGQDAKEVGIYGGNIAFKPTLDFPQITKCVVADKTTADGKLSISIEVSNAN